MTDASSTGCPRRYAAILEQASYPRDPDQDVQYLSSAYISTLKQHGIEISLARRGCPWENGYAERFIRTLKEEEVHLNDYEDITDASTRIGHFIYHHKRPHSALGYLTKDFTPYSIRFDIFRKKIKLTILRSTRE